MPASRSWPRILLWSSALLLGLTDAQKVVATDSRPRDGTRECSSRSISGSRLVRFFPVPRTLDASLPAVSALEIEVSEALAEPRSAQVTIHHERLEFDRFGDAAPGSPTQPPVSVALDPIDSLRDGLGCRVLYRMRFSEALFERSLYVVIEEGAGRRDRLLLAPADSDEREDSGELEDWVSAGRHADFGDGPEIESIDLEVAHPQLLHDDDAPLAATWHLETSYVANGKGAASLEFRASRDPARVEVTCDRNLVWLSRFGDVVGMTVVGYTPQSVRREKLETPDSSGRAREIHTIEPVPRGCVSGGLEAESYSLVLDRNSLGAHRVLVWRGTELVEILPARDRAFAAYLRTLADLHSAPPAERDAVRALRAALGNTVQFETRDGRVRGLWSGSGDDLMAVIPQLRKLRSLRHLVVRQAHSVPVEFHRALVDLPELERLELIDMDVTDEMVWKLRRVRTLRYLSLENRESCGGASDARIVLTDRGVSRLSKLRHLRWIELRGVGVSGAAVRLLEASLPNASIFVEDDCLSDDPERE